MGEEAARQKAEEEEAARRKAQEEEEARRKAEEEARLKAEEEEAKRKAEADKSWLQQAMDFAEKAQQLEESGQTQEACDLYKKCVALFAIVQKKEKSEKIKEAIQVKMQDLTARADQLTE